MKNSTIFFREKVKKIFTEKKIIVDIGGGLRVSKKQGNRYDKQQDWITPMLSVVEYKIMDLVSTYSPDVVGDIHKMPFQDNSLDAIICLSVLEHVENPILAAKEMHRTLKPEWYSIVYVPFLYYYHAEKGYYGDFWRFTEDSIRYIFRDFSDIQITKARGAIETWIKLSPLGRFNLFLSLARFLDWLTRRSGSCQTSGFYVFLIK